MEPAILNLHRANGSFGNFAEFLKDESNRSQNKTAHQAIPAFTFQHIQERPQLGLSAL
jgi:hypothetical protein